MFFFFFWKVRAGSLQDLVYKGGQAGITKASVTLTFDNRDRKQSPLGYEQYEEITVTRQVRCTSVVACYQDWLGNLFKSIYEWNSSLCIKSSFTKLSVLYESWNNFSVGYYVSLQFINLLTPNDPYMGRTAPLTSKHCILYIYSTNTGTEYFKHALYSPFFLFKMQFVS